MIALFGGSTKALINEFFFISLLMNQQPMYILIEKRYLKLNEYIFII